VTTLRAAALVTTLRYRGAGDEERLYNTGSRHRFMSPLFVTSAVARRHQR
jgi:hypothetical protein